MNTADRIELIDRVAQLRTKLTELAIWLNDKMIDGAVYPLPMLQEAKTPTFIVPEHLENEDALQSTCEAITRIDRYDDQHPSTVIRLPGWVQLNTDPKPMIDVINDLKTSIQKTIREQFTTTSIRNKECRKLFPSVQMNQLYRHIHPIHPDTNRISFHWQPRSSASTHLTVKQALKLLNTTRKELSLPSHNAADQAIVIAMERVSTLDDNGPVQLICRTPLAPHPRAALFADGVSKALVTHHANLPLLLPPTSPPISVRPLPTFDASVRGKPRGQPQRRLTPILEIASLYAFNR